MTILKPLGFTLMALTGAFVALLAFAASQAVATTPTEAFAWPAAGPGGTTSTIVTIVSLAIVALGATAYGYVALRRAYASEAPRRLQVLPGGRGISEAETDDRRKAA